MKKLNTRQRLFIYSYLFIYLLICYVKWEVYNPIESLKLLPTYDPETRFMIFFTYAFSTFMLHFSVHVIADMIDEKKMAIKNEDRRPDQNN